MPQMMPMNWILLYMNSIFLMFLYIYFIYSTFMYNPKFKYTKLMNKINWKW
uniref:ATP synthase F0 subunit 8 n=1 Tax=Ptiliidae sp. BMNH 1274724 TaxID=1796537 RepID=A0A126TGD7_9COLE|nr:ATP synthase F0 subunit 8 [Ptiliidae sp. BMNH 1274724]